MSCRCDDIADCCEDMEKLRKTIDYLEQLLSEADTVMALLSRISTAGGEAFRSVRTGEFQNAVNRLDDHLIEVIREAKDKAESKLESCERQLPGMEREDESYHEEEESED